MAYRVRVGQIRPRKSLGHRDRKPKKPFAYRVYNGLSFEAFMQDIKNERDFLDSFLQDCESSTPCWNTHVIRMFCQTLTPSSSVRSPPEIYLDDRERGSNRSRDYPDVLTPETLRRYLQVERFGDKHLPDADYRQIRVHNLDAETLLALARTSAYHQVDALRDAFAKHISGATSFRVHESVNGFVTPRPELHLPYLSLRVVSSASDKWNNRDSTQEGESWLDLPLPDSELNSASRPDRFLIEKAHISIVLCVWDYTKWVGYAFSKGGPAYAPDGEPDQDEESDGEESDTEGECPVPKEDIFAPQTVNHGLYAEKPIRDPREYFLRIVDVWIAFVLREYTYLVRVLEACVRAWQKEYRCTFSSVSCKRTQESVTSVFDNIVKILQLLHFIKEQLCLTTQAWTDFSDPLGDINCFDDIRDTCGRVPLKNIKASFRELVNLEKIISSLVLCCQTSAKDLKLGMGLESQFLNYDSNRLNHESNYLQREAHQVNLKTQQLNQLNTKAALRTSRTTQTNVFMIFITTPCLVVLQYFGADRPIFTSFDRSPRNFGISLCILTIALPILTCSFNLLCDIYDTLVHRLSPKTTRKPAASEDSYELDDIAPVSGGA